MPAYGLELLTKLYRYVYVCILEKLLEGSLEANLPTIWTDGKAEVVRVKEGKRREGERRSKRESLRRKKTQVRQKVVKSRVTMFFQRIVALEGRKIGSLKRRARSHVVK